MSTRNLLVHDREIDANDILRAIDSGLMIYKAIRAIPREVNEVEHPHITVYSDAECAVARTDVRGVGIKKTSAGGAQQFLQVFPTTKTTFQKGQRVSWEWNATRMWDASWYIDPQTGQRREAWSSALEFVGRNLSEITG